MERNDTGKYFGYCRVSTENQKDDKTIDCQEIALKDYAKEHNLELVAAFKDEGFSGKLEIRPGLTDLLTQLRNSPDIEGVLIYKLDRLARDIVVQENLIKEFQNLRKRVVSTLEPDLDSNDPTRKLVRQVLGVISEYERAMITMRLSGGRINKALKGGYAGGGVPFGYKANTISHTLVNHEPEAEIVKKIRYLKRYKKFSFGEISETLNKERVPTKRGGKWYPYTIWYILRNSTYGGYIHYGDVKERGQHKPIL